MSTSGQGPVPSKGPEVELSSREVGTPQPLMGTRNSCHAGACSEPLFDNTEQALADKRWYCF